MKVSGFFSPTKCQLKNLEVKELLDKENKISSKEGCLLYQVFSNFIAELAVNHVLSVESLKKQ